MRRDTSSVSCSLNWAGALRARLSVWIATSALLRPGRLLVPEKMTPSMSAARSDLCEVSPIAQRSASTRFDLPQPFGPTTPVSPGSIRKSVGSTKDLKPSRRSRVSFIKTPFQTVRAHPDGIVQGSGPGGGSSGEGRDAASTGRMNRRTRFRNRRKTLSRLSWGWPTPTAGSSPKDPRSTPASEKMVKKSLSTLEIRGDLLVQFLDREGAAENLAIDEEGRRGVHIELRCRPRAGFLDAGEHLLIRQAFVEALLGEAGLLGDGEHRLQRLLHHPVLLLREEGLDQRKIFVLAGAARQHGGGGGQRVERKFPENEANLAGIDVFLLQLRVRRLVEMAAVRAGHRGIFDDGDRGIVGALDLVAQRARRHQLRHRHFGGRPRGRLSHRRFGRAPQVIAGPGGDEDGGNGGG